MSSHGLIELAVWQFAQLAVAIMAVSIVTRTFCRRNPHLAYVLWLLVLVKSLVPPIWHSPIGIFSWAASQKSLADIPVHRAEFADFVPTATNTNAPAAPSNLTLASHFWQPERAVLAIWIAGGIGLLLVAVIRSWNLRRRIVKSSVQPPEQLQDMIQSLCRSLGLRRCASLRLCTDPVGPAIFGIFRPMLVMPASLLQDNNLRQLRTIAAHEIIHLRRCDPLVAGLQLLSQAVWWFNPLVWWMNRRINHIREICCDSEVVAALQCPAADYAQMLIDVLRARRTLALMPLSLGIHSGQVTQSRLYHIMHNESWPHRRTPWRYWALAAFCGLLLLPGAGILSSRTARAQATPPTTEPAARIGRTEHFVRIVVGVDSITFQGQPVQLYILQSVLAAVPDRPHTVLQLAYASDDVTMGQFTNVEMAVGEDHIRRELGFEYLDLIGKQPADSKGPPDHFVLAALPPAPISELTHLVPFQIGKTQFEHPSDSITITEVRADRDTFQLGGTYQVSGIYHLASQDHATLALRETAKHQEDGWGDDASGQKIKVNKGDGRFTLIEHFSCDGYPHVSFEADEGNIGGVYFGTGDSVWKR